MANDKVDASVAQADANAAWRAASLSPFGMGFEEEGQQGGVILMAIHDSHHLAARAPGFQAGMICLKSGTNSVFIETGFCDSSIGR